jgi:hypothetical protein
LADIAVAIQSAIEVVQRLRTLSKKIEDAEVKMLLADLSSDLADAKLEAANLKFEIVQLKENLLIAQALGEAKVALQPRHDGGGYRFEGEQGLFCVRCFDGKGKKFELKNTPPPFDDFGKLECPVCKGIFG